MLEYPTLVKSVRACPDGALEYTVAKKSIGVNKPIILTDEQREKNARFSEKPSERPAGAVNERSEG